MRDTLADPGLARYAGRFVWLKLDFDRTENRPFVAGRGVPYTPSFYVIDPTNENATATQLGAMTLRELTAFLERGERGMTARKPSFADGELARGDDLMARDRPAAAVSAYEAAHRAAGAGWSDRDRAVGALIFARATSKQWEPCAEEAIAEAPRLGRHETFGRVVLEGLKCVDAGEPSVWAATSRPELERLAVEAIASPETVRDHRFQLYQELMATARERGDTAAVNRFGEAWLKELDSTAPENDDERSALDIARVDAAMIMVVPLRVLPALLASERSMPHNYNASLRVAQMELLAGRLPDAIAACDRGLERFPGPLGRAWLLQVQADALMKDGRGAEARRALESALDAAGQIGPTQARENNVARISKLLAEKEEKQQ